ncbi:unnamed protein product, partial [Rotaria sordida]
KYGEENSPVNDKHSSITESNTSIRPPISLNTESQ